MRTITTPAEMLAAVDPLRRESKRIAFVPTMGALHAGHGSLLEEGRRRGDVLVLSIFVNPLQFAPTEDLARYPRTPEDDLARAEQAGVDIVYAPTVDAMYPAGYQTKVVVTDVERGMEGDLRPGHFSGVATVVLKLFNVVRPHVALFGQKDYQQLQLIRRMTIDLDLAIDIVAMPIIREADGLAMSSRNVYLSPVERTEALALSRALRRAEAAYDEGERDAKTIIAAARAVLPFPVEYLELRDATSLAAIDRVDRSAVLAIAARIGRTRLIDNVLLG